MTEKPDNSVPALPDTEDPEFLPAVKEMLEVRTGQRGADPLDVSPTWRTLIEYGFAGQVQNGSVHSGVGGTIGGIPVIPTGSGPGSFGFPDGDSEIDWSLDTSIPDPPANVTVSELLANIIVRWDLPHPIVNYAEIWRAEITDVVTDPAFEDAVFAGTGPFLIYSETLSQAKQYRYWVRFVSLAGITGPVHDLAGTDIATSVSNEVLQELLQNQIDQSYLTTALADEIDLITPINDSLSPGGSIDQRITTNLDKAETLEQVVYHSDTGLAAVEQRTTATETDAGNLLASWTMKVEIDQNGNKVVGGIGLAAEIIDGVPSSSFAVRADRISFSLPNHDSFALGIGTVNGRDTVIIPTANIGDATITNAKVENGLDVGKLTVNYGSTLDGKTFITDGTITEAKIGDTIGSAYFVKGDLEADPPEPGYGWRIWARDTMSDDDPNKRGLPGEAQFFNIVARGDIEATSIKADSVEAVSALILNNRTFNFPIYIADTSPDTVSLATPYINAALIWNDVELFTYKTIKGSDGQLSKIKVTFSLLKISGGVYSGEPEDLGEYIEDIHTRARLVRRQPGYADVEVPGTYQTAFFGGNPNIPYTTTWELFDTPQAPLNNDADVTYILQFAVVHTGNPPHVTYQWVEYRDRFFELVEYQPS